MIDGGKVHYNGQRTKPGKLVENGAVIVLRQGNDERTIRVLGITDKRLSAPLAQTLWEETPESIENVKNRACT